MPFVRMLLIIGLVAATPTAAWAKVLLEYRVEGSRVVGWTALAPEGHRMDGRVRFREQPSLAVSRGEDNKAELPLGCRWVSRPVQVVPGEAYTVCAQVRAAEVTAGAVGFQVNFYATAEQAHQSAYTKEAVSDALIGEATDWTFVAHTFVVPEGRQFAVVWCRTDAAFLGRAWFSHVCVFKGDALPVPVVETPPVIDGDLGDEAWTRAIECQGFYVHGQRIDSPSTTMRLLFTDKMVCLAADCEEPAIDKLLQAATKNDENDIWRDDGIELFTATQIASTTYHQFIFNTLGSYTDLHRRRIQWNARDVKVKADVREDRWTLEIAIPLSNFRTAFMPGQDERGLRWNVGLCRNRYAGKAQNMSWGPRRQFHRPKHFVPIYAEPNAPALVVDLEHWIRPEAGLTDGSKRRIVAFAEKPLYKELLTANRRRFHGHSGFVWRQPFAPTMDTFALKLGIWYDRHFFMEQCRDAGLGLYEYWLGSLENAGYPTRPAIRDARDRANLPAFYYARFHGAIHDPRVKDIPMLPEDSPFYGITGRKRCIFDPRVRALALEDLKRTIRANRHRLIGVGLGDEVFMYQNRLIQGLLPLWHEGKIEYPYFDRAVEEIRSQYGFGKYGPPLSVSDKNPFRWIALYKWFLANAARMLEDFHDTARAEDPDLILVGPTDALGYVYGVSRMAPYVDVWTGQMGHPSSSPHRFTSGFNTKRVVDTVGKDVWPAAHFENSYQSYTGNEVVALWSDAVRCGATGIQAWPWDGGGTKVAGASDLCTQFDYYGHPPRWNATVYVANLLKTMPRVQRPKPDAALIQSNITAFSVAKWQGVDLGGVMEGLYTFIGPRAGVWFDIVEDFQLIDGKKRLNDYKAAFLPAGKFASAEVVRQTRDYVYGGGTLVIADPEAYSFHDDGTDASPALRDLAGVSRVGQDQKALDGFTLAVTELGEGVGWRPGQKLNVPEPINAFTVRADAGVEVLARRDSGAPAVTRKRCGRGQCVYFAFNPGLFDLTRRDDWVGLFKTLCKHVGLATDQDIWRFQLPLIEEEKRVDPKLACLTGNHFQWWLNVTHETHNAPTDGMAYRYSRRPERVPDQGAVGTGWIPLGKGDLTDRRQALRGGSRRIKEGEERDWVVGYGPGSGFDITFDLAKPRQVHEVVITYQGDLPRVDVSVSGDATQWTPVSVVEPRPIQHVDRKSVTLKPQSGRYVRFRFGQRRADLTLSEIEIWGPNREGANMPTRKETSEPAEGNLVVNPGFEEVVKLDARFRQRHIVPRQWQTEGDRFPLAWQLNWRAEKRSYCRIVEDDPHQGQYCFKVWGNAPKPMALTSIFTEKVKLATVPVELNASIWARGRGTIGLTLYTYGKVRRAVRSIPFGQVKTFAVTDQWRQYEARLRVTDTRISEVRMAVNHWPGQTGGEFYYDDASLTVGGW